jgi:hypothetical protein
VFGAPVVVATVSASGVLTEWEARTGRVVRALRPSKTSPAPAVVEGLKGSGDHTALTCVSYRGDGTRLAVSGYDGAVRVVEEETGKVERVLAQGAYGTGTAGHGSRVFSLSWDNSVWAGGLGSNILVSGGWDRTVRVWDVRSPDRSACVRSMFGPAIHGAGLSAAGGLVLTASYRPTSRDALEIWDIASAKRVHVVDWPPSGRDRAPCTLMAAAFAPTEPGRLPTMFAAGGGVGANEARLFGIDAEADAALASAAAAEPLDPLLPDGSNPIAPTLVSKVGTRHTGTVAGVPGAVFTVAFGGSENFACAGSDGAVRIFGLLHASSTTSSSASETESGIHVFGPGEGHTAPSPAAKPDVSLADVEAAIGGPFADDDADEADVDQLLRTADGAGAAAAAGGGAAGDAHDTPGGSGLAAAKALAAQRRTTTASTPTE